MASTDLHTSITAETELCFKQFTFRVDNLKGAQLIHIKNRHADFRLCADSVGAVAEGKLSLDHRFQTRQNDIYLVKNLLQMLKDFLIECTAVSEDPEATEQALRNIDSIVRDLASIGVAIRRSGRKSRLQRADASFDRDRQNYETHLICVIVSKCNDGPRTLFDSDQFAKLELSVIQNRLIDANLRRRHRFIEAQKHSLRLKGLPDRMLECHKMSPPTEIGTRASVQLADGLRDMSRFSTKVKKTTAAAAQEADAMPNSGTAAASEPETGLKAILHRGHAGSTFTRITKITAAARYPRVKTTAKITNSEETQNLTFKCPCCCQAIGIHEADDSTFKKHLANDICPYTCFLENCPTPLELFVTAKEWHEHVMDDHPLKFQLSHIARNHHEIPDDELVDMLLDSEVHFMGATECPFGDAEGTPDSPELVEHILEHVHDFSLRSLPWPKDTAQHVNKVPGEFNMSMRNVERVIGGVLEVPTNTDCNLQLCDFDRHPPLDEHETLAPQYQPDYFAQNDYFTDEYSDGHFPSDFTRSSQLGSESSQELPGSNASRKFFSSDCELREAARTKLLADLLRPLVARIARRREARRARFEVIEPDDPDIKGFTDDFDDRGSRGTHPIRFLGSRSDDEDDDRRGGDHGGEGDIGGYAKGHGGERPESPTNMVNLALSYRNQG